MLTTYKDLVNNLNNNLTDNSGIKFFVITETYNLSTDRYNYNVHYFKSPLNTIPKNWYIVGIGVCPNGSKWSSVYNNGEYNGFALEYQGKCSYIPRLPHLYRTFNSFKK